MANGQLEQVLKKFKLNEKFISQVLGALVIVVVGILIYNYFSGFEGEIGEAETTLEEVSQVVELIEAPMPTDMTSEWCQMVQSDNYQKLLPIRLGIYRRNGGTLRFHSGAPATVKFQYQETRNDTEPIE